MIFDVPPHLLNWHDAVLERVSIEGATLILVLDFPLHLQSFHQEHLPENLKIEAVFDQVRLLSPEWSGLSRLASGTWDAEIRTTHFQAHEGNWSLELAVETEHYQRKIREPLLLMVEYGSLQLRNALDQ